MTKNLSDKDVIATFRTLLSTVVYRHGTLNRLVISREDLEACQSGKLSVQQLPDGSVELRIRALPPPLKLVRN